jgi:hypothetical protein
MDITLTPDTYSPSIDDNGNYIDNIPPIRHGITCPCGPRKDKTFESATKFSSHIKTKMHQKWLVYMNQNKMNYFVEQVHLKEEVHKQRLIIQRLENQIQCHQLNINCLTKQLVSANSVDTVDLLGIE